MRRVYYIFALRLLKHPLTTHSFLAFLCLMALSRVVSIPDVWRNMLDVKVGELAQFWISAFFNADGIAMMLTILIVFALASLPWRWWRAYREEEHNSSSQFAM